MEDSNFQIQQLTIAIQHLIDENNKLRREIHQLKRLLENGQSNKNNNYKKQILIKEKLN
ncbi:hypothetical protein [Amphibacillus indicireducens]|uniref:Transposase n=1 Tax=Amphibacillus indicireducens TaxID=1076330 RepID=A0ABP7V0G0_9BACI